MQVDGQKDCVCVGGKEQGILFLTCLNSIYISQTKIFNLNLKFKFKTEKGGELCEYLPGNVAQTQPSTFGCPAQIQVTP